jgi:hypothetical protein
MDDLLKWLKWADALSILNPKHPSIERVKEAFS